MASSPPSSRERGPDKSSSSSSSSSRGNGYAHYAIPPVVVDRSRSGEVLRALLHTLVLQRTFGGSAGADAVVAIPVDIDMGLNVCYLMCPQAEADIDKHVADFAARVKSAELGVVPVDLGSQMGAAVGDVAPAAGEGQRIEWLSGVADALQVSFVEKRRRKKIFWEATDYVRWEQWTLTLYVVHDTTSPDGTALSPSDRLHLHSIIEGSVQAGLSNILDRVASRRDHVPPIDSIDPAHGHEIKVLPPPVLSPDGGPHASRPRASSSASSSFSSFFRSLSSFKPGDRV